jgi:hypothetical protein
VNERLPCFATAAPAPAATNAAAVEMLKVETVPPPVPQVSTRCAPSASTRTIAARNARAAPVSSATVSPFTRKPISRAAICTGLAAPAITTPKAAAAAGSESDWRLATRAIAWASGVGAGWDSAGTGRGVPKRVSGLPKLPRKIAFCQMPQRVACLD